MMRYCTLFICILFIIFSCSKEDSPANPGEDPAGVIHSYYAAVNRLDYEQMENCLIRSKTDPLTREVAHISVLVRIRSEAERADPFIPADRWIERGKPSLEPSEILYGISDLEVNPSASGYFTVTYKKWTGRHEDIESQEITERISIETKKGRPMINRIEKVANPSTEK